ncbi:MAG TPA: hypothetical protein VIF43_02220 [Patescibacteria group bacterium]|jgi:hypothetical protein
MNPGDKTTELDERRFAAALEGDAPTRADAAAALVEQGDYERAEQLLAPLFDDWAEESDRCEHMLNLMLLDESYFPPEVERDEDDCLVFVTKGRISALMAECVTQTRSYGSDDFQVRETCRYLWYRAAEHYSGAMGYEFDDGNFEFHPLQHEAALGAVRAAHARLGSFVEHPDDDSAWDRIGLNQIGRLIGNPPPEIVKLEQEGNYPLTRAWVAYIVESRDFGVARRADGAISAKELRFDQLEGAAWMLDGALSRTGYEVAESLRQPVCERLGEIIAELEASDRYGGIEPYRRDMIEKAKREIAKLL